MCAKSGPIGQGWVFSVWVFRCHMWALHELHNSLNFLKKNFKDDLKNNFKDDLAC